MGRTKNNKTVHIISLGCAKNTVDSDSMAQLIERSGYRIVSTPKQAAVIIVNTCGFIGPAKKESLSILNECAAGKQAGQKLIAAGCLTQRYGAEVLKEVSGIDGLLGTRRWMDIVQVIDGLRNDNNPVPMYHLPGDPTIENDENGVLRATVQGGSAYLKIADGCRRPCAFCAIPLIKGKAVSRPLEAILEDARRLRDSGLREVNLIAQDTTDYGHDLGMKDGLSVLLERLTKEVPEIDWIRILYAFPGYVTDRLIEVMASNRQIVPYLDMPLQHAHPSVLRRMRRPPNLKWIYETIDKMRSFMPELTLRTTFIVGYPNETEKEFQTLLDFIEDIRFDRIGVFQFSFETGTTSESLGDPVPREVKQERYDRLMERQHSISLELNQAQIGKTLNILVEGNGDGISIGRSYRDAPEIDGMVVVEGLHPVGDMVPVRITGAMPYDLSGVPSTAKDHFSDLVRVQMNDRSR